jgi:pimeloyl-ACP methyl ester carboxylesterase
MESPTAAKAGPRVRGAEGVELATFHLGGDGPPVIAMHATGFHGRCWGPLAMQLAPSFSVWAVDQRGHGASGKAPSGRYDDWSVFVDDLFAVLDALGEDDWRAIGHSMGGAVLMLAEARRPGTFLDLCCYEPVVFPPTLASPDGFAGRVPMAELARKRRPTFPSRQAAYDNYASKPPFERLDPAALAAYINFGFVDEPGGGVTLACAREDEASVFEGAPRSGAWDRLAEVRPPVTLLGGGDMTDPVSFALEEVARHLPRGGVRRFAGLDHFGPFEDPVQVGDVMAEALGGRAVHHDRLTP